MKNPRTQTARTMRKPASGAAHTKLLSWAMIKGRIISRGETLTQFASGIGCHPNALRMAVDGKCPHVLRDMQARLGPLTA